MSTTIKGEPQADIELSKTLGSLSAKPLTEAGKAYCKRYKGVVMRSFLITQDTPDDMLRCGLVISWTGA